MKPVRREMLDRWFLLAKTADIADFGKYLQKKGKSERLVASEQQAARRRFHVEKRIEGLINT